jgi:hypothetical protein
MKCTSVLQITICASVIWLQVEVTDAEDYDLFAVPLATVMPIGLMF